MSFSRKYLAVAVIVLSLGLLAYALLGASDEDKVVARLKELASAIETKEGENILFRTARLKGVFKEALEPAAALSAPEFPTTTGRDELAALAGGANRFAATFQVSVGETNVRIDDAEARVVAKVTLTGVQDGELRRDERHVRFLLRKDGGEWRVASIDVQPRSEDQPEARP